MNIGFGAPVSGAWATPASIDKFARAADDAGYSTLWSFQRLLIPQGSDMEPVYRDVLDPMAALAFAAAVTTRIRLGVAIINLPFVSPGYLAKQAASLDVLSAGRHDLGLGIGWMPEEFSLTGADMARRGARTAEYVQVLRRLWSDDSAELKGDFYHVPAGDQSPKPVQAGGPPILLGGMARPALQRIGRIADGWVTSSRTDLSRIAELTGVVRESAEQAGRDPARLRVVCRGVVRAGEPVTGPDGARVLLSGSIAQIHADAAWLGEQGVTELFFDLNWDPQIGNPAADPAAAQGRAMDLLEALAPGRA